MAYVEFKLSYIKQTKEGTEFLVREYRGTIGQVEIEPGVFEDVFTRTQKSREYLITPNQLENLVGKRTLTDLEIRQYAAQNLDSILRGQDQLVPWQTDLLPP